jgi:hypothetical protein
LFTWGCILESDGAARVLELNVLPELRASLAQDPISSSTQVFFSVRQMVMVLVGSVRKNLMSDKKKPRYIGPFHRVVLDIRNPQPSNLISNLI